MANTSRATLKTYFQTGDRPTQAQFDALIDSLYPQMDKAQIQGDFQVGNTETDFGLTLTVPFDGTIKIEFEGSFAVDCSLACLVNYYVKKNGTKVNTTSRYMNTKPPLVAGTEYKSGVIVESLAVVNGDTINIFGIDTYNNLACQVPIRTLVMTTTPAA